MDLVMEALADHRDQSQGDNWFWLPRVQVSMAGGKPGSFPMPPLPEISVEATPERRSRMVHMLVQVLPVPLPACVILSACELGAVTERHVLWPENSSALLQVPLVPSVVLPVVDALSWDVSPGAHRVAVNLEMHDRHHNYPDKFNAAAVVAFGRTRTLEDVCMLQGSSWHGGMLRSGDWLGHLRERVGEHSDWKLKHVYSVPRG